MPRAGLAVLLLFLGALHAALIPTEFLAQSKGTFRARLSPVPIDVAMQSRIAGRGQVTAKLTGSTLTITGEFFELKTPATTAHVHRGPKGIRGPAILELTVTKATSGTLSGTFELTPDQIDHLNNSRLYVQVHSEKAPEGNLWGWLLPQEGRR
jgi:hypothetical protein